MSLSLVPLLLTGKSISPEARQALRENRLQDAGELLMRKYGLTGLRGFKGFKTISS